MAAIETLDRYVLKTLDCLEQWKFPKITLAGKFNLFMGSGNAFNMAKMFARHFGGVAVDATNYAHFVGHADRFDGKVIVSASGGKDAVRMAEMFKGECVLFTCSSNPPAAPLVKKTYTFPALEEPPSYNTSTYASMIHSLDPKENVSGIRKYIERLDAPDFKQYPFVPVVSSDENEPIAHMCATKFRETLGIGSVGKSMSEAVHGWFLHERKNELVMCLNVENSRLSENEFHIDYPSNLGVMLSAYYAIGKSQNDELSAEILNRYKMVSKLSGWKFGNIV